MKAKTILVPGAPAAEVVAKVIILSRAVMEELQKQDKFTQSGLVNVAGTPVSVHGSEQMA
jgi:hypothetical protein